MPGDLSGGEGALRLAALARSVVARATGRPEGEVPGDVDLRDLGLDSVDLAGVLVEVEDGLGTEVPVEAIDELVEQADGQVTLDGVVRVLGRWLAADGAGVVPSGPGRA